MQFRYALLSDYDVTSLSHPNCTQVVYQTVNINEDCIEQSQSWDVHVVCSAGNEKIHGILYKYVQYIDLFLSGEAWFMQNVATELQEYLFLQ